LLLPTPAHAQAVDVKPGGPNEVDVTVEERIGRDQADRTTHERARKRQPARDAQPKTYIVDVTLRVGPDGARCAYVFMTQGDPASSEADRNEMLAIQLASEYGICQNSPRRLDGTLDPATAAALVWQDSVELPDPVLEVKPGHAITGKPAYLEISSPRTLRTTTSAFGHAVELSVTSVLDIDWGDGTVERGVTRQGGPWPSGDISHVYVDTYQQAPVHVTQRWKATWRVGTQSGVITDQLFTESTLPLPVRELQAVRER
jgi:hypothetical protein